MNSYQDDFQVETDYLKGTLEFIQKEIEREEAAAGRRKQTLVASRKDMLENTLHYSQDYSKMADWNQYFSDVSNQTAIYLVTAQRLMNYRHMLEAPYFGRFDFIEEGREEEEKIYVGLHNVIDQGTNHIYVYDWRAPIASVFYRYEPGQASFQAPGGLIAGEVTLKRQYKISQGQLKYFFDCSLTINDEILQEVLSRNSSPKMRSIVETIQKEQDLIIRDTSHELLMVQGSAGSGKTSVALHRIAYLLYDGLKSPGSANDFLILSPNAVFGKYIASVLPELGEENVAQATFDDLLAPLKEKQLRLESRTEQLEDLLCRQSDPGGILRLRSIPFKGSADFGILLDRMIRYFEHHLIPFEDVYYNGVLVETRQGLKNLLLKNKSAMPLTKRLEKIRNMIWEKVYPLRQARAGKIQKIVQNSEGHDLEVKSFSRLLSIKETKILGERLQRFTQADYLFLYRRLFSDRGLFLKLSKGLKLPAGIEEIITDTCMRLEQNRVYFEDGAPLLYLKLKLEGSDAYSSTRHVVVDESQDYYPLQYQVMRYLFRGAKFTVLGDFNQCLEKERDSLSGEMVACLLDKKSMIKMDLLKSYRSSFEISRFAGNLLPEQTECLSFERYEEEPKVMVSESIDQLDRTVVGVLADYRKLGLQSMAVICKTGDQAEEIYQRLKGKTAIGLLNRSDGEIHQGAVILPAYMAKGLEFDGVIVYDASQEEYTTEFDRRLLYIACTRALHRLVLLYTGAASPFLQHLPAE